MERRALTDRWFSLTRDELPALARSRDWPVHRDHCFQRILLDNAVGGFWRDHIAAPAWRCASNEQMALAIALGEEVAAGRADLRELNAKSLGWRGKV